MRCMHSLIWNFQTLRDCWWRSCRCSDLSRWIIPRGASSWAVCRSLTVFNLMASARGRPSSHLAIPGSLSLFSLILGHAASLPPPLHVPGWRVCCEGQASVCVSVWVCACWCQGQPRYCSFSSCQYVSASALFLQVYILPPNPFPTFITHTWPHRHTDHMLNKLTSFCEWYRFSTFFGNDITCWLPVQPRVGFVWGCCGLTSWVYIVDLYSLLTSWLPYLT